MAAVVVNFCPSFVLSPPPAPSAVGRTAHSLALGCILRYVGGMDANIHLQNALG